MRGRFSRQAKSCCCDPVPLDPDVGNPGCVIYNDQFEGDNGDQLNESTLTYHGKRWQISSTSVIIQDNMAFIPDGQWIRTTLGFVRVDEDTIYINEDHSSGPVIRFRPVFAGGTLVVTSNNSDWEIHFFAGGGKVVFPTLPWVTDFEFSMFYDSNGIILTHCRDGNSIEISGGGQKFYFPDVYDTGGGFEDSNGGIYGIGLGTKFESVGGNVKLDWFISEWQGSGEGRYCYDFHENTCNTCIGTADSLVPDSFTVELAGSINLNPLFLPDCLACGDIDGTYLLVKSGTPNSLSRLEDEVTYCDGDHFVDPWFADPRESIYNGTCCYYYNTLDKTCYNGTNKDGELIGINNNGFYISLNLQRFSVTITGLFEFEGGFFPIQDSISFVDPTYNGNFGGNRSTNNRRCNVPANYELEQNVDVDFLGRPVVKFWQQCDWSNLTCKVTPNY